MKDKNKFPKRSTLRESVDIELVDVTENQMSASNAVLFGKYMNLPKDFTMTAGLSVIHGTVAMAELFTQGLPLMEGTIKQIISGLISQIGYSPTAEMVNQNYIELESVIDLSADAHALLTKMWLIQNGRQAQDVTGASLGSAFFYYPHTLDYSDATKALNGKETSFDNVISNAAWLQDYVGKLQYTYTTHSMRATIIELFGSVKELVQGYSATNSYLNLWPSTIGSIEAGTNLKEVFDSRIQAIRDITSANPLITQILSYLGFQTGSEFDYTRALDQKLLIMQFDSPLAEFLSANSHTFAPGNSTAAEIEEQDLIARRILLEDNTPLDVTSNITVEKITLANLLRGIVQLSFMTQFIHTFKNGVAQGVQTRAMICLLNQSFKTSAAAGTAVANTKDFLNELSINQVDMIDFDSTYELEVTLQGTTAISGWTDVVVLSSGYGTFFLDYSSLDLARKETALSIAFGARYRQELIDKLNAIPMNIIKTV